MEKVFISDNNVKITLFLSKDRIFYVDHNNSNIDINKYIKILSKIDVDYFNNNGEYCICYEGKGNQKTSRKLFRINRIIIICALSASMLIGLTGLMEKTPIKIGYYEQYNEETITLDTIREMIYSSNNLTEEEKAYLYNEDFFTDILPFINSNNYLKAKFKQNLHDLNIVSFGYEVEHADELNGFYNSDNPNTLHIKNYEDFNSIKMDTLSHEFVHLCQDTFGYNLIIEACAEIISNEYYENTTINAYNEQVKLVKTLMEIIGSKPIWVYNFTGDFSLIEKSVKPYLSNEEYEEFLSCLTFEYFENNEESFNRLRELLSILYKNINNQNIEDNQTISLINSGYFTLHKNYFNSRDTDAYYIDYQHMEEQTITIEEAVKYGFVTITASKITPISYEEAISMVLPMNYTIKRDIKTKGITMLNTLYTFNKEYCTCVIDGVTYENVDIDELVAKGIIEVDYYLTEYVYLSIEDYLNHNYPEDMEAKLNMSPILIYDEEKGTVSGKMPMIVNLNENESYHL